VTNVAFEGFPCYWFESVDGAPQRGWLRSDVSIECYTPSHYSVMTLSWFAIITYPIGLWVGCLLLLYKASDAIVNREPTNFSRAIEFLYKEYDVRTFWWELMEMLRKFLLVGIFVIFDPGTILQIAVGTIVSAAYLMIQVQAAPYKHQFDDVLAQGSNFCLLMVFFCCVIYKYDSLLSNSQFATSSDQVKQFVTPSLLLTVVLVLSIFGSLLVAILLVVIQFALEMRNMARLKRLKYAKSNELVVCSLLSDPEAFHLFLSYAWPTAQDRMCIVKQRFAEVLPSCRVFLDVDAHISRRSGPRSTRESSQRDEQSTVRQIDSSGCILVFCTASYFEKQASLEELYRSVAQRRPVLAMLEPEQFQDGGLKQLDVVELLTDQRLEKFELFTTFEEWKTECPLLPNAFDHAPSETEVCGALFTTDPVEWNRTPQFQDVTIRLIAERGILQGLAGELYIQGEVAVGKITMAPPSYRCTHHLFCSPFNAGAVELADELQASNVFSSKSAVFTYTTNIRELTACNHMLVLLDERTWTSGTDTAHLVEHIHSAMRAGVHIVCAHESPSVVGAPRHECEFDEMFSSEWTPIHLTRRPTNLYSEAEISLKGEEWRQPSLVAFAAKLAANACGCQPINFEVPMSYKPKTGTNPWRRLTAERCEVGFNSRGSLQLELEEKSVLFLTNCVAKPDTTLEQTKSISPREVEFDSRDSLQVGEDAVLFMPCSTQRTSPYRERSSPRRRSHLAEDMALDVGSIQAKAASGTNRRTSFILDVPPSMRGVRKTDDAETFPPPRELPAPVSSPSTRPCTRPSTRRDPTSRRDPATRRVQHVETGDDQTTPLPQRLPGPRARLRFRSEGFKSERKSRAESQASSHSTALDAHQFV